MSERHFHDCPQCYEAKPCDQGCTFEPDLYDHVHKRAKGSHVLCDQCADWNLVQEEMLKARLVRGGRSNG